MVVAGAFYILYVYTYIRVLVSHCGVDNKRPSYIIRSYSRAVWNDTRNLRQVETGWKTGSPRNRILYNARRIWWITGDIIIDRSNNIDYQLQRPYPFILQHYYIYEISYMGRLHRVIQMYLSTFPVLDWTTKKTRIILHWFIRLWNFIKIAIKQLVFVCCDWRVIIYDEILKIGETRE